MSRSQAVTLSTKCWEGDYRALLTPDGIDDLFAPFGPAKERQVILNRIEDVAAAEKMAQELVAAEKIDRWIWAEQRWPEVAKHLGISEGWFGAAWPYSVPELCELDAATAEFLLHIAGDVRFRAPEHWLDRALEAFDRRGATVVTATPPAGTDWVLERGRRMAEDWSETQIFSDQLFLARGSDLLSESVVRSEHSASAKYPKPGGALTFEARVGGWLAAENRFTLVDLSATYLHPVTGREGDSYERRPMKRSIPVSPKPGTHYPKNGSSQATGLVISDGDATTIGASVSSLEWCSKVIAVDVARSKEAEEAARLAGATIRSWEGPRLPEVARRQILSDLGGWIVEIRGDEVLTASLARQLADSIERNSAPAMAARSRVWIGRVGPPRSFVGAPTRIVAYKSERIDFGTALDGYPLIPRGASEKISPKNGAFLLRLAAADIETLVEEANIRSGWRADNLVLERTPSLRMPLVRLIRSYFGGAWRHGRLGPHVAAIEAFEEWLMIQKYRENIAGGADRAVADFEEVVRREITGEEK